MLCLIFYGRLYSDLAVYCRCKAVVALEKISEFALLTEIVWFPDPHTERKGLGK